MPIHSPSTPPLLQQGLSLGRGEDLAGAVDPAAGDAEAVRGVHQVAERERAVPPRP